MKRSASKEYGMPKGSYFDMLYEECENDKVKLKEEGQFTNTQKLLHIGEKSCECCKKLFYLNLDDTLRGQQFRKYCYDCDNIFSKESHQSRIWLECLQKSINANQKVRKGVCDQCGKKIGDFYTKVDGEFTSVKRTFMYRGHHECNIDDPIKDTIELCQSCLCAQLWKDGFLTTWKINK